MIPVPILIDANGGNVTEFTVPHVPGILFHTQTIVAENPAPDPRWRTSNEVRTIFMQL